MKCLFVGVLFVSCATSFLGWVSGSSSSVGTQEEPKSIPKLNCYVCSWSSSANITNNIDTCSTHKFRPENAAIHPCEHGCQTVSYRNAKNEGRKQFFRNCLKVDKGSDPIQDRCIPTKESSAYGLEDKCQCLSNLCNHSTHLQQTNSKIFVSTILTIIFSSVAGFS